MSEREGERKGEREREKNESKKEIEKKTVREADIIEREWKMEDGRMDR